MKNQSQNWEALGYIIASPKLRKAVYAYYTLTVLVFMSINVFIVNTPEAQVPQFFAGIQAVLLFLSAPIAALSFVNTGENIEEETVKEEEEIKEVDQTIRNPFENGGK